MRPAFTSSLTRWRRAHTARAGRWTHCSAVLSLGTDPRTVDFDAAAEQHTHLRAHRSSVRPRGARLLPASPALLLTLTLTVCHSNYKFVERAHARYWIRARLLFNTLTISLCDGILHACLETNAVTNPGSAPHGWCRHPRHAAALLAGRSDLPALVHSSPPPGPMLLRLVEDRR